MNIRSHSLFTTKKKDGFFTPPDKILSIIVQTYLNRNVWTAYNFDNLYLNQIKPTKLALGIKRSIGRNISRLIVHNNVHGT